MNDRKPDAENLIDSPDFEKRLAEYKTARAKIVRSFIEKDGKTPQKAELLMQGYELKLSCIAIRRGMRLIRNALSH